MKKVSKILDIICEIYRVICIALMSAFIVIVLISIFFRYVLNNSIMWSEQVCRYLFVWMIMLGAPVVFRKRVDVSFDLIVKQLPQKVQDIIRIFMDIGVAFLGVFMGWQGQQYSIAYGTKILAGIEIPQWMMYISQPICGYTLALFCIEAIILACIDIAKPGKEVAK